MPTFPTYDGELPSCLNPWNPRHYLLVLYWVYFRPTALKCYLYQANPEIYELEKIRIRFVSYSKLRECKVPIFISFILIFLSVIPCISQLFVISGFFAYFTLSFIIKFTLLDQKPAKYLIYFIFLFVFQGILISAKLDQGDFLAGFLMSSVCKIYLLRFFIYGLQAKFENIFPSIPSIFWDEMSFLISKKAYQYLFLKLTKNNELGLKIIADTTNNPFCFLMLHAVSWRYLNTSKSPIENIYLWTHSEELDRYSKLPVDDDDWELNISSRERFFSYLINLPVDAQGKFGLRGNFLFEFIYPYMKSTYDEPTLKPQKELLELIKVIHHHLRLEGNSIYAVLSRSNLSPIELDKFSDFTRRGFNLFQEITNSEIRLSPEIDKYPYGSEVRQSFDTILNYLQIQTLHELTTAYTDISWLNSEENLLRPSVIKALKSLALVSKEVYRSEIASSTTNKLSALSRANEQLRKLIPYITEEVHSNYPEHKFLLRITDQWTNIITPAAGQLGHAEILGPIANPYVAGNPVTGKLFVGRDDILQRIEELWTQPDQLSSIVLYGHRRMGKTSILRNLPGRFGPHTHIIDFNLQRVGMIDQLSDLIYRLAIELHDALPSALQTHIPEPTEDQYYNTHNPTTQLDRLLKQIQTHRQNDRFIIAIDEFEILEDLITQGKIEPTIIAYLRALIQTYPWFILIFAGLHTLQEMTENYWNPLFGSVTRIRVSTLSPAAAYPLITNPTDDFPLDYDQDAIDRIIHLSGGQPYLTQLLCQSLITRFNRIRFEERREIEPRFTLQDVETIVANPDFYRDGNAYFSALWDQAAEIHAPTQHLILRTLTQSPLKLSELTDRIPNTNLIPALQTLLEHDVITLEIDRYTYRVELLRLWVTRQQSPVL